MVKVREDMTGWIMAEHGVANSRLTVVCRGVDYIRTDGRHEAQWLCQCSCGNKNLVLARGSSLRNGDKKSCGCLYQETFNKGNRYDLSKEYGIIWTTNTNEEVYFDLDVADQVLQYTWYKDITGYASAQVNGENTRMHTLLGYYCPDHNNRNKLDNRSCNLFSCTKRENNMNATKRSDNSSGVIGVYFSELRLRWKAQINDSKNHTLCLGSFKNKEEAIKARLKAEQQYYGNFAPQRHLFEQYGILNEDIGGVAN